MFCVLKVSCLINFVNVCIDIFGCIDLYNLVYGGKVDILCYNVSCKEIRVFGSFELFCYC